MFELVNGMIPLIFILVFCMVLYNFVQGIITWNSNNQSPRLTVFATVVAKREDVTRHHHANAGGAHGFYATTNTTYYVTFQVESGDRMEFHVSGKEYGMLTEGDTGRLSFQGTRYLSFERDL